MCGRYTGYTDETEELKTIYDLVRAEYSDERLSEGEIYPTNLVPILRATSGRVLYFPAKWGYPGVTRSGVVINARAETVADKPMFTESMRCRRCVIPTTGYYEWSADGRKYRFNTSGTPMLYLAGLYTPCLDYTRFVVLTTEANASVREVHHRMPVVLRRDEVFSWMTDVHAAFDVLRFERPELMVKEA